MSAKIHSLGIVGRKAGMSRMFTEDGTLVATVAQEGMMRVKDLSVLD